MSCSETNKSTANKAHKPYLINQNSFLKDFSCLGDKCPDTCCKNWDMPIESTIEATYQNKASELLESLTINTDGLAIMKRDSCNDHCVQFKSGLCGIHQQYGANFLGDACYFYPRITRKIGDAIHMTASLSCPEAARLMLYGNTPFILEESSIERLPSKLNDYGLADTSTEEMIKIHNLLLDVPNQNNLASTTMAHLITIAKSLDSLQPKLWYEALPLLISSAHKRLIQPSVHDRDQYNLIAAFVVLLKSSNRLDNKVTKEILKQVEQSLQIKIDPASTAITLTSGSKIAYEHIKCDININTNLNNLLNSYIKAQIASSLFPFAGSGDSVFSRVLFIAFKFALIRLLLLCFARGNEAIPDQDTTIKIIQSTSRMLEHLSNHKLLLLLFKDFGWNLEDRLLGLVLGK